jgi:hypothetical protein
MKTTRRERLRVTFAKGGSWNDGTGNSGDRGGGLRAEG